MSPPALVLPSHPGCLQGECGAEVGERERGGEMERKGGEREGERGEEREREGEREGGRENLESFIYFLIVLLKII